MTYQVARNFFDNVEGLEYKASAQETHHPRRFDQKFFDIAMVDLRKEPFADFFFCK